MIVVDTNVLSYLLIEGQETARAHAARRKDPQWAAPVFWRSEFRNVLALHRRKGLLARAQALVLMGEAEELLGAADFCVDSSRVLDLAASSGCTAYDCEFVALAETLGVPLVTTDREVLKAFPATAVSLPGFAGAS